MILQRAEMRPPQPWRNGRGVQYEIAANGPVAGGWTWRLSTADITEDVPFSVFPGVVRYFCVADGRGVELTIAGVPTTCRANSITRFLGDAEVHARLLDGPMKALNLMTMNDDSLSLRLLSSGESVQGAPAVVAVGGDAALAVGEELVSLHGLDAVLDCAQSRVVVREGYAAALVVD